MKKKTSTKKHKAGIFNRPGGYPHTDNPDPGTPSVTTPASEKAVRFYSLLSFTKSVTLGLFLFGFITMGTAWSLVYAFDKKYEGKIYPQVSIAGIPFGGKTENEAQDFWTQKNDEYQSRFYEFRHGDVTATMSGRDLNLGYDAQLSAKQAYLVGRSGNVASDLMAKISRDKVNIMPVFNWDEDVLKDSLTPLADSLYIPVEDALFEFSNGKVTEFKPSKEGREVDIAETIKLFESLLPKVPDMSDTTVIVPLVIRTIKPAIATDHVNDYGIRELIGRGYSEYQGSIPGRKHNVALAASRIHGVLIKPGEVMSFNDALGDVSAATGFQPAYIIKSGRTVLGDGGGVCQVSTTLFRAALNAGLPIVERSPHAYRVHYYEEAGYKAGIDATVFSPSVDLKIKNNTPAYILIQTKVDESVPSLTFELYGTSDGRKAEILDHKVWGVTPPPPPLYQDDPTLPVGVTKQVDFAAWGAKASFQYKVLSANGEVLEDRTYYSSYRPWQAVFLKGTKTP